MGIAATALAARARASAPRIVSSSPIGCAGTVDSTETASTLAAGATRSKTARVAASFTGFVEPTATLTTLASGESEVERVGMKFSRESSRRVGESARI